MFFLRSGIGNNFETVNRINRMSPPDTAETQRNKFPIPYIIRQRTPEGILSISRVTSFLYGQDTHSIYSGQFP